jgi:hypothetical protein
MGQPSQIRPSLGRSRAPLYVGLGVLVVVGSIFFLRDAGAVHHGKDHGSSNDESASAGGDDLISVVRSALGLSRDKDRRKSHGSSSDDSAGGHASLRGDDPAAARNGEQAARLAPGGAKGGVRGGDSVSSGSNDVNPSSGESGLFGALRRVFGGGQGGGGAGAAGDPRAPGDPRAAGDPGAAAPGAAAPGAAAPGAAPPPCAAAGQSNCTPCTGGLTEPVCTPTESLIMQSDLDKGISPSDPDKSCYGCLTAHGCLGMGDQCEQLSLPGVPGFSAEAAQLCRDILSCAFRTHCAETLAAACYCGDAPLTTSCQTGGANGQCFGEIVNGAYTIEPKGVLKALSQTATPAGLANAMLHCAGPAMNDCSACLH